MFDIWNQAKVIINTEAFLGKFLFHHLIQTLHNQNTITRQHLSIDFKKMFLFNLWNYRNQIIIIRDEQKQELKANKISKGIYYF